MDDVVFWVIEHGFWVGAALFTLVLFLVIGLIVGVVRDREDDGFEPIGEDVPPPPQVSPFRGPRAHP